jgi:hypothetical protein
MAVETVVEPSAGSSGIRYLTRRVAIVHWQGYWFTVSQVRWGFLRRLLYRSVYRHACPPNDVRYETAVFLSHRSGRFNPQKPLHVSYQINRNEAQEAFRRVADQVASGSMSFQSLFQKNSG